MLLAVALACSEAVEEKSVESAASAQLPLQPAATAWDVVITDANVYEHERHWPNIVALTKEWRPPGEPNAENVLQAGIRGALIRVDLLPVDRGDSRSEAGAAPETRAHARIDFGRHGPHEVPIDHTDLVERASEVRRGLRHKTAPNFVLQVGTRLVDSSHEALRPVSSNALAEASMFLCVFANPEEADFEPLVRELADLEEIEGLRTIFFPQALDRSQLAFVKEKLQALSWTVPFAYPHLSEGYTRSLIGAGAETPFALLVTPNGRVLYRSKLGDARALDGLRDAVNIRALEAPETLER